MKNLWHPVIEWLTDEARMAAMIRVLLLLAVGFLLIRLARRLALRTLGKKASEQAAMLVAKGIVYGGNLVLLLMVLRELGFDLSVLIAAAGVAGIAIGFAAQTSLSNLISGFFLIWEKPFVVGDAVALGDTMGLVHSIDLLSVKLRTFDNRFIRVPNETLVKNTFVNITRFPIRRFDLNVGVAYKEDIARVIKILGEVADRNPYCLDEPEPVIIFTGFGDSSLNFLLGAWFAKADFLKLRNSLSREVKERFDQEDIEIPFPHRSLYFGSVSKPFPVQVVGSQEHEADAQLFAAASDHDSPAVDEPASRE